MGEVVGFAGQDVIALKRTIVKMCTGAGLSQAGAEEVAERMRQFHVDFLGEHRLTIPGPAMRERDRETISAAFKEFHHGQMQKVALVVMQALLEGYLAREQG